MRSPQYIVTNWHSITLVLSCLKSTVYPNSHLYYKITDSLSVKHCLRVILLWVCNVYEYACVAFWILVCQLWYWKLTHYIFTVKDDGSLSFSFCIKQSWYLVFISAERRILQRNLTLKNSSLSADMVQSMKRNQLKSKRKDHENEHFIEQKKNLFSYNDKVTSTFWEVG